MKIKKEPQQSTSEGPRSPSTGRSECTEKAPYPQQVSWGIAAVKRACRNLSSRSPGLHLYTQKRLYIFFWMALHGIKRLLL